MKLSWNALRGLVDSTTNEEAVRSMRALVWVIPVALTAFASTSVVAGCAKVSPGSPGEGPQLPTETAFHHAFAKPVVAGVAGEATSGNTRNARVGSIDGLKLVPSVREPEGVFSASLFPGEAPTRSVCPAGMASIDGRFCVDRYEASLVEILPSGETQPYPYYLGMEGHDVRAVSVPGVKPQAHISEKQATEACRASGKRLCKPQEWRTACMGPEKTTWGYGADKEDRRCNDHGKSPIGVVFPRVAHGTWGSWDQMNDQKLNQVEGTLAETGSHAGCTNGYGVYDMVGNLHEWVDDPKGTFQGGYYQDTHLNGDGCGYKTTAHNAAYHDYSTGFRCCADADGQ